MASVEVDIYAALHPQGFDVFLDDHEDPDASFTLQQLIADFIETYAVGGVGGKGIVPRETLNVQETEELIDLFENAILVLRGELEKGKENG